MKKFSLLPPPPPPELPQPGESLNSSYSSVSPGAQQYSPSRATSPNSDPEDGDSIPPPPTSASLPPTKVLGSSMAKKRLQAFAKMKLANSPKTKSAPTFSEEEDHDNHGESLKEVKHGRSKKYPLVKEATPMMASIMKEETLSRDLVQKNMERKEEVDLRDLLNSRKKREDPSNKIEPLQRRSRSREKVRRRKKSGESQSSFDQERGRLKHRTPSPRRDREERNASRDSKVGIFDESPNDLKRRRRGSGDSHKMRNSSGESLSRRRSGSGDGRRINKSRTKNLDLTPERVKKTKKLRRSSGASSKTSISGGSPPGSGKKKLSKAEKWDLPDLMDEMKKKKVKKEIIGNNKDRKGKVEAEKSRDRKHSKDIDLWELKHGKKNEGTEDRKDIDLWDLKQTEETEEETDTSPDRLFTVPRNSTSDLVLIKANVEDDYFNVKQEDRKDDPFILRNNDGFFIEFPIKFMKETSHGVSYSYNLSKSNEIYLEAKKSAKIRKSIDSMMSELENQTKKKSREKSGENADTSGGKKKKKNIVLKKGSKKRKKMKDLDEENEDFNSSSKKKKKIKKTKPVDKSLNSATDTSPEPAKKAGASIALSAGGLSKLFSMAGYPKVQEKDDKSKETGNIKQKANEDRATTPVKEVKSFRHKKDSEYSPSSPLQDETEEDRGHVSRSRSPSPSLIADLSRLSDRQDDGPRLPKMKDSRSPSKVPIMRDCRSPYRDSRMSKRKDESWSDNKAQSPREKAERDVSPGIRYSPLKNCRVSPVGLDNRIIESPVRSPGTTEAKVLSNKIDHRVKRRPRTPSQSPSDARRTPSPGRTLNPVRSESARTPLRSHLSPMRGERAKTPPKRHTSPERKERSKTPLAVPNQKLESVGPSTARRAPVYDAFGFIRKKSPSPRKEDKKKPRTPSPPHRTIAARVHYSPSRRGASPGRRSPSPSRRGHSPGRRGFTPRKLQLSPDRCPRSPRRRTPSPRSRRTPSPRRRLSPRRRTPSPRRRGTSPRRRSPSPRRRISPRMRSPSRGREPSPKKGSHSPRRGISPRLRSLTPRRGPSPRRGSSPRRRLSSPRRRSISPGGRRSPMLDRPRRPRTPSYSPGRRRSRSPVDRLSGRFSPRSRDYRQSPDRRRYSPERRRYSPDHRVPDSTISDAELARQMPPPSGHYHKGTPPPYGYGPDSPKRLSLDERLEREHGIKMEQEQMHLDFSRPPPPFPHQLHPGNSVPTVTYHHIPLTSPAPTTPTPGFSTGLPAMIPTYDDSTPVIVKGPPYPGSQKVANEKEKAIIAAQAIQSKLQEMQAAQKEEEKRKKEQKMAERIAQLEAAQPEKKDAVSRLAVGSGRILEEVEKQETEMKDGDKRKRKREKDSPMLITLKPFYRPNEKKGLKKRKLDTDVVEDSFEEEEFTPRSPVPLPDQSNLRPVLRPYMTKSQDKSRQVKYADGVLPGLGSPDHNPPVVGSAVGGSGEQSRARRKRYKWVTVTVITQHTGDTDSEGETPPPPPPGSPTRYSYKELLMKYGLKKPV